MPKLHHFFIALFLCFGFLRSQEMAPNPTFERILNDNSSCPQGISWPIGSVADPNNPCSSFVPPRDNVKMGLRYNNSDFTWTAIPYDCFRNQSSPDYFNTCVTPSPCDPLFWESLATVPGTGFGNRQPLSGAGFVGLYNVFAPVGNNQGSLHQAEYITSKLVLSMKKGNSYYVRFNVALAPASNAYIFENLGAFFTKDPIPSGTYYNYTPLPFSPQVHNGMTGLTYNQNIWTPIYGGFVAKDNFDYITIGVFKPNNTYNQLGNSTSVPVCFNHDSDDPLVYYFLDSDGNTPMVRECKCDDDLEIILVPITNVDDGDDCCYTIKIKNNGECTQEIVGLRVKDLGSRFAGASNGDLKVVPEILQVGDDVGFFVQETYTSSLESGLSIAANQEKVLGTICVTPGTTINGKFILLRNEFLNDTYAEKCEKYKTFSECVHANVCCTNVLNYLKVKSVPTQDGGECCNMIEGAFLQPLNSNCSYSVRIERESNNGWDVLNTPTIDPQGKFSFLDCTNFRKKGYKITLIPSNGGAPCTFIRSASCKTSCCDGIMDIDQIRRPAGLSGCEFDIVIELEFGSCISSVNYYLTDPNQQSGVMLNSGPNTFRIMVPPGTQSATLIFGDIFGNVACTKQINLECSNCCSKVNGQTMSVTSSTTTSAECCYTLNGTIPDNNGCITEINYLSYDKETGNYKDENVPISGDTYNIDICVKTSTSPINNHIFRFLTSDGKECILDKNLPPCLPDCCDRIVPPYIQEYLGDCCFRFTGGNITNHQSEPCFTHFTYQTFINGQWVSTNGTIDPNGQYTIQFCVPPNTNTSVIVNFYTSLGLVCPITLNGNCEGPGGPPGGGL